MTFEQMIKVLSAHLANSKRIVPGYYSVDGKRYRLDMPSDGKWKDWVFLSTGSDYHSRKRILVLNADGEQSGASPRGIEVMAAIQADPIACMTAYGETTGKCSVCGRKLEDPISVKLKIGPVCLGRLMS